MAVLVMDLPIQWWGRRLQAETYYGDVIPAEPATTSNSAWAGAKSSTASITSIANIQT